MSIRSIRRTMNERPSIILATAGVVVLIAIIATVRSFGHAAPIVHGPARFYFSDDDGKTFFADKSSRIPPFDHNGKEADLAGVFRCGGGPPYVAYLARYSPEGKAELEKLSAAARNSSDPKVGAIKRRTMEVKFPGQKQWTTHDSIDFDVYLAGSRPKGEKGIPTQVLP